MFEYRYYQKEQLNASVERAAAGVLKQLFVAATGTGKTPLTAGLAQAHGITKRQMVLVHREELANQAAKTLKEWNPKLKVGIEMADSYASDSDDIVVASVPTIGRAGSKRLVRFVRNEFGILVTDEAHHATNDSYKSVYRHFGCLDLDNDILSCGVTATPNRPDQQGMGQIYDEIVHEYTILNGIRDGFLCNIRGIKLSTRNSLDSVGTMAGDFNQGDLSRAVDTDDRNKLVVAEWMRYAKTERGYRPTVAFCASVDHCKRLAQAFKDAGIKAEAIWDSDKSRKDKLAAHRRGEFHVICNVGILTEGYDDWRISCVIMATPTKSNLKYTQCVGRGTRIQFGIGNLLEAMAEGIQLEKVDCIVLDVVDATSRHSLTTLASLFGLAPKADLKGEGITDALEIVETTKKSRPQINLDNLIDINQLTTKDVDLFEDRTPPEVEQNTKLKWTKIRDTEYQILLPMGERVNVYCDILGHWDVKGTVAGTGFAQQGLHSLPEAFRVADNFIQMFGKGLLNSLRQSPIAAKPKVTKLSPAASPDQIAFVKALYKNNPKVLAAVGSLTHKEASSLIASFKSKKVAA